MNKTYDLKIGSSRAASYATVTQRNNLWFELTHQGRRNKHGKESFARRKPLQPEVTETSKIMKSDTHSRICPWISTTHRDMYGQCFPKTTERRSLAESLKKSKPENMHRLVCSIKHVPVTRMDCYNDGYFRTTYSHDFVDFDLPDKEQEMYQQDYNMYSRIENPAVPYDSKTWSTSYRFDYGQFPQPKTKPSKEPVPTFEEISPVGEPFYKSDWLTSYQEYGLSKQRNLITTIPYPNILGTAGIKQIKAEPTSEVAKLMRY